MHPKFNPFHVFLWSVAFAGTFWLCLWPMVMNSVALHSWRQVPCIVKYEERENLERYHYVLNGVMHTNRRRDFWDAGAGESVRSHNLSLPDGNSRTCYVHPADDNKSVLYLEGIGNLSRSGRAIGLSTVLIAFAFALTFLGRRKHNASRA